MLLSVRNNATCQYNGCIEQCNLCCAGVCAGKTQTVCGGDGVSYQCPEAPQQKGIAVVSQGACKQIDPRALLTLTECFL